MRGIAILGETALTGDPFRRRTTAEADCPFAAAVVERLIALGEETATAGASSDLRDRMLELFERYRLAYQPDQRVEAFLREGIDAIGAAGQIPFVFQHGDPGTWNILVATDGTIGFLDWEAADPAGIPLWDLFYFLRSFAVTVSRARGTEDSLAGIRRELFAASELTDVLGDATRRAREQIGVPVAPRTTLRHLLDASRGEAGVPAQGSRLRRGHYHRLLTAAIEGAGRRACDGSTAMVDARLGVPESRQHRLARLADEALHVLGPGEVLPAVGLDRPAPPYVRILDATVMWEPLVIQHTVVPRLAEELEHRLERGDGIDGQGLVREHVTPFRSRPSERLDLLRLVDPEATGPHRKAAPRLRGERQDRGEVAIRICEGERHVHPVAVQHDVAGLRPEQLAELREDVDVVGRLVGPPRLPCAAA